MKRKRLLEDEINYNIYNALNLFCEDLGELYLEEQFNPFPPSFELNENFIVERYINSLNKKELQEPEFIQGKTKCLESFNNGIQNCNNAIEEIDNKLLDPTIPESLKEELKKLKLHLNCRLQLLIFYSKNLSKNKCFFKMYSNIESLDWNLIKIFEDSYSQQFNVQIAINAYLEFAKQTSETYKQELKNKQLIEKAKQIIINNTKQDQVVIQTEQAKQQTKLETPLKYSNKISKTTTSPKKSNSQQEREV